MRCLIAIVALSTAGCTSSDDPVYTLTGQVSIGDKSLQSGAVVFLSESGRIQSARIGADGSYAIDLEAGSYRIGVQSTPEIAGDSIQDQFRTVQHASTNEIPQGMQSPNSSGISVQVEARRGNVQDVHL